MDHARHIGIMGGTFDPIHLGHLAIARSAARQLGLDRVLFIPTGNPNFKQGQKLASAQDRVAMVKLAIADDPIFELDSREVERAGVTYSADTLVELAAEHPDATLDFIMGTDSAITLPHWRRALDVARLARIIVCKRPGQSTGDLQAALAQSDVAFDVVFLDVPQVDVSSTQVRQAVARGLDIGHMVPVDVAQYIDQAGLYLAS